MDVAGNGSTGTSGDGGPAAAATFTAPNALLAIAGGGFYVADSTDCVVRKIDAAGNVSTVAGVAGSCGNTGDGGPATSAELRFAVSTAVASGGPVAPVLGLDGAGNLYVAGGGLQYPDGVREIDTSGNISTVSGTAVPLRRRDDGGTRWHADHAAAEDRRFRRPTGP